MPTIGLDLDQMLRDMAQGHDSHANTVQLPIIEAQWAEAEIVLRQTSQTTVFHRGDRCRPKHLVGNIKNQFKDRIGLTFWRYLNWANPLDARRLELLDEEELMHFPEADCLVMVITGDQIQFRHWQSSFLELVPAAPDNK